MKNLSSRIRTSWEKNWPELYCTVRGGLPGFVLARQPCGLQNSVPVFCYHVVDPQAFEEDLAFLERNGYTTVGADYLLQHLSSAGERVESPVVLSFDDGARNLYEVAFPLLKRFKMKAVAFIAPRFHFLDCGQSQLAWQTPYRPCSWAEIREMQDSGFVDFQSHTYEHRFVPRWPETADLMGIEHRFLNLRRSEPLSLHDDFRAAKQTLEQQLGKTVDHLAFPRFQGTEAAVTVARQCGYQALWWGLLPSRNGNRPQDPTTHIVRVSGEFLRRLPGVGRLSLKSILRARYTRAFGQWLARSPCAAALSVPT